MNPIQERVAEDMAKATNTHNPDAISLYMVTRMLLDDVTGLTRSSNYEEALTLADRGMKKLEQYMEEHPSEKSIFEFTLFQLYGMKANCFVQLGQTDVAYKKLALKQIEMAFNATSNVPQIMHTVMMQLQADLKKEVADKEKKCFIATAAYGSASAPDVEILRTFRDTRLKTNRAGRGFIYVYEHISPPMAQAIASHRSVRWLIRYLMLKPIVRVLSLGRQK